MILVLFKYKQKNGLIVTTLPPHKSTGELVGECYVQIADPEESIYDND